MRRPDPFTFSPGDIETNDLFLTVPTLSPGTGNTRSSFVYTVNYTDALNTPPWYMWVYIDGTYYSMSKQNSGDNNYTDGCIYTYNRTLSLGSHTYYFSASNGTITNTTSTFSGPIVYSNNNAPTLTGFSLSPSSGYTETMFTYTITYTDVDNNPPTYMYVYINGSGFSMSKQTPGDITYSDGCVYTYSTTLTPIWYTYSFSCSDGSDFASTSTYAGPTVANAMPTLTSGAITPSSGNQTTTFMYSVTYADADNNAPSYVRVYIDGTYYNMSKQNSGDTTYTDGCVYTYSRMLSPNSHEYYYQASDGYETATTSTYSGPMVSNNTPTLTSGSVSPASGTHPTTFTYTVTYIDADNNAPSYVRVHVDGTYYSMSKQNSGDVTYTDGCVYTHSRTLSVASHIYNFSTSDGYATASTSTYSGPTVTNNAPTLTSGSVSPTSGTSSTTYAYTVTYTDADNESPSFINVYINGSGYIMSKQNSGDVTYTDGCVYTYSRTLSSGSYSYYFYTSDGYATASTSSCSGPTVSANALTLTAISVSPSSGSLSATFTYTVTYVQSSNIAPSYVRVYIDSSGSFITMSKQNSGDTTYTDGCIYTYSQSLAIGSHTYYFAASDGLSTATTSTYSGPTVTNTAPTLSYGAVSPSSGTHVTSFTYTVTYTDADGHAPSYVRVYIDSSGSYITMSKQNSGDTTYTDGCIYTYSQSLAIGSHNYYFRTTDGYSAVATSTYSGPTVTNTAPTLSYGSVSPSSGTPATAFTYTVIYTDADDHAPSYVRLYIDTSGSFHTMSKQDNGDTTYTDGCVYTYSRSLSTGSHTFYFVSNDGSSSVSTTTYYSPSITPISLSLLNVSPESGDANTNYQFRVKYTNYDNIMPSFIMIYIDSTAYTMMKLDSGDSYFVDGCDYVYSTTLYAGIHQFYVASSQGGNTVETNSILISVSASPAIQPATAFTVVFILIGIVATISTVSISYKIKVKKVLTSPLHPSYASPGNTSGRSALPPTSNVIPRTSSHLLPPMAFVTPPTSPQDGARQASPTGTMSPAAGTQLSPTSLTALEPILPGSPKWAHLARYDISMYYAEPDENEQLDPMGAPGDPMIDDRLSIVDADAIDYAPAVEPTGDAISDQTNDVEPAGDALGDLSPASEKIEDDTRSGTVDEASDTTIIGGVVDSGEETKNPVEKGLDQVEIFVEIEAASETHEEPMNLEAIQDTDVAGARDIEQMNETGAMPPTVLVVRSSIAENEALPVPTANEHVPVAICPSCKKKIQISKLEGQISYYCRACKRPLHFEVTCAFCFSTIEITQDELQNAPSTGFRCIVCSETIKM